MSRPNSFSERLEEKETRLLEENNKVVEARDKVSEDRDKVITDKCKVVEENKKVVEDRKKRLGEKAGDSLPAVARESHHCLHSENFVSGDQMRDISLVAYL